MKVPLISSVVSMFYFKLLKGDQSIYSIYKHNTEQSFPLLKLFFWIVWAKTSPIT